MSYQRKYLADGSPNPKYKPDNRNGDRHKDKGKDRHTGSIKNRHTDTYQRAKKKRRFIAIDGEGVTTGKYWYVETKSGREPVHEHIYVTMLSSSGEQIVNEHGLSTVQCFDFLLELAKKYGDAIFII